MAHVVERVQARQRRPEAAVRRPATAEAQRPRTTTQLQTRLAAPVAAGVAERVSQTVAAKAQPGGLPPGLRSGIEALSGLAMDDVRVHRNSAEPAKLGALAFARGSEIHLGPGQEQHLPHEAWHVVQQKQGRVKATAQLKGVGINDERGLEAEADRMGDRIDDVPTGLGGVHRSRPATSASKVIQAKIIYKGKLLESNSAKHSPTVEHYISDPIEYIMSKTCLLRDDVIFLMERKYYILGEFHGRPADRRWNKDVAKWSEIPKFVEEDPLTPGIAPLAEKALPEKKPIVRATKPFESVGAQFMLFTIFAYQELNYICSPKVSEHWMLHFFAYKRSMNVVWDWMDRIIPNWLTRIPADPAVIGMATPGGDQERKKAAADFVKTYQPQLDQLRLSLRKLAEKTYFQRPPRGKKRPVETDQACFAGVDAARGFIPDMIAKLVAILPSVSGEDKLIAGFLGDVKPTKEREVEFLKASSPIRERVMLANLEAVRPPVLVKTGAAHAKTLANWFGAEAESLSQDTALDELTAKRRPK